MQTILDSRLDYIIVFLIHLTISMQNLNIEIIFKHNNESIAIKESDKLDFLINYKKELDVLKRMDSTFIKKYFEHSLTDISNHLQVFNWTVHISLIEVENDNNMRKISLSLENKKHKIKQQLECKDDDFDNHTFHKNLLLSKPEDALNSVFINYQNKKLTLFLISDFTRDKKWSHKNKTIIEIENTFLKQFEILKNKLSKSIKINYHNFELSMHVSEKFEWRGVLMFSDEKFNTSLLDKSDISEKNILKNLVELKRINTNMNEAEIDEFFKHEDLEHIIHLLSLLNY